MALTFTCAAYHLGKPEEEEEEQEEQEQEGGGAGGRRSRRSRREEEEQEEEEQQQQEEQEQEEQEQENGTVCIINLNLMLCPEKYLYYQPCSINNHSSKGWPYLSNSIRMIFVVTIDVFIALQTAAGI